MILALKKSKRGREVRETDEKRSRHVTRVMEEQSLPSLSRQSALPPVFILGHLPSYFVVCVTIRIFLCAEQ